METGLKRFFGPKRGSDTLTIREVTMDLAKRAFTKHILF